MKKPYSITLRIFMGDIFSNKTLFLGFRNEQPHTWNDSVATRNNLDAGDLSKAGVSSPPPDIKNITIKKKSDAENWDWLNN